MANQRWKDKLRPASFRGVRFLVDTVTYEGGRRGPDFEFPDRDEPYAEDTGKRQTKYDIEAYFVGSDYFAGKNRMIKALEKKGSGDLVHPYYGRKKVVCRGFTVSESSASGGFVKFSLKFVEAGSLTFPKTNEDRAFLVGLAGKLLGDSAANALSKGFDVADKAEFVAESATEKVEDITSKMDIFSAGITGAADPLAEFAFAVKNLKSSATDLVLSPLALANNIADAFGLLFAAILPSDSYKFSKSMFAFGSSDPIISETTGSRIQQASNQKSLNLFVQTTAVINSANAAVEIDHKSTDDALIVRDSITDQIDSLMEQTDDDDVYTSLQNLRAQVTQAVPGNDQDLAHIAAITPNSTLPSLALSYDLYGSVDEEQDIIDRNKIRHPGFIQGGQPLEVLSDG